MNKPLKRHETPIAQQDNPWSEIANEYGSQTLLKFVKGDWKIGEEVVPEGTKYIAFVDELARGFIKFKDREVAGLRMEKVASGTVPTREELGDVDQSEWEIGDDGKPSDPWQEQWQLPMASVDCVGELVVFPTGSDGGIKAIANLCGIYGRSPRNGMLPIVELRSHSYQHKKHGEVHEPVLKLVGWHQTGPVVDSIEPPEGFDPEDEIPF